MFDLIPLGKILSLLISYRYAVFFPLTIIEGPIVTIIAGFLSSLGYFNFLFLYIIALAGDLIGDVLYYSLGRWGSSRLLSKASFLGINSGQLGKLERHFELHAGKTLLFGKWTQTVGAVILTAAGMSRMRFNKYIFFNAIGSIPKCFIFLIIGYYFGQAYAQINTYFGYAALSIILAIALAAGVYLFVKWFKKRAKIN